ncbi:hypothetical protein [Streptomyces clavifer]|uniref:hypothetical protein n=1 Tax=Streptomyces clavifer TaxID=68188 RepID=UPI0037F49FA9
MLTNRTSLDNAEALRRGPREDLPLRPREGLQNLAAARGRLLLLVIAHTFQGATDRLWTEEAVTRRRLL